MLKNVSISVRLLLIVGLAVAGFVAIAVSALTNLRSNLLEDRQQQTRALVESAVSFVDAYHRRSQADELTEEQAQEQALAGLNAMRYGQDDYFFVIDDQPTMVMHATTPALNGSDLSQSADPNGVLLFVEMVDRADGGGGFVPYQWARPDSDVPVDKISYVAPFDPWGWIIGTGIYVDDVDVVFWNNAATMGGLAAAIALLIGATSIMIARGISIPIERITQAMGRLADGDKTIAVGYTENRDQIGGMARAVEVFKRAMLRNDELTAQATKEQEARNARAERVNTLTAAFDEEVRQQVAAVARSVDEMRGTAGSLAATAEQTSSQATAVAVASEQASSNVQMVATATEELGSSVHEISRQVQQQKALADEARDAADQTREHVRTLAGRTEAIGDVVDLITSIAEQTNLLALNATIEAARAGEAGKGFAIVAAEVNSLADQTGKATEQIGNQIKAVQEQTGMTATAMGAVTERIEGMAEISATIASAVEEQNAATQEIGRNITEAAQGVEQVTSNIGGVSQAAERTGKASGIVSANTDAMSSRQEELDVVIHRFLDDVRAA